MELSTYEISDPDTEKRLGTARVVLPEGYYLDHFRQFVESVHGTYVGILEPNELELLAQFPKLSEAEQKMFVRLSNRTRIVFFRSSLKYAEIESIPAAIEGLAAKGFIRAASESNFAACLAVLTKHQLVRLLRDCGHEAPLRSMAKPLLQELARNVTFDQFRASTLHSEVVIRNYAEELRFLCFLAFGDLHSDLRQYALRDLGLKFSTKRPLNRRFETGAEARSEFYYRNLRTMLRDETIDELRTVLEAAQRWPPCVGAGAARVRDKLICETAKIFIDADDTALALRVLTLGTGDQAVEKRVRLLAALGRLDDAKAELQSIFDAPSSAALLFFAEEFAARRFSKQRKAAVTLALEQATKMRLDGRYRGRPEQGVVDCLNARGERAYHCENDLWRTLFGLTFWHELFECKDSALHSEFELVPSDLVRGTFYASKRERIEIKLAALAPADAQLADLRERIALSFDTPNGVFRWDKEFCDLVLEFLEMCAAAGCDVRPLLREMAQDFERSRSGFPDLLVFRDNRPVCIEVKSLGDKLQPVQLRKLRLLSDCGFRTEIIRIEWDYDPQQVFVVVDVETTGLFPERNRVTEFAAVKVRNGDVIGRFASLINPQCRIPSAIVDLNGITNEMTAPAPVFAEIAEQLAGFTADAIFVGHNARFDHGFLSAEFRRLGQYFRRPMLCTSVEMRRAYPGLDSYSLGNLCREFSIPLDGHHRATCDAEAAVELLLLVLQAEAQVTGVSFS